MHKSKEAAKRVMGQMVKGVESCQNSTSVAHNLFNWFIQRVKLIF